MKFQIMGKRVPLCSDHTSKFVGCGSVGHLFIFMGCEELRNYGKEGAWMKWGDRHNRRREAGSRRSAVLCNHGQRNVNIWKLHAGGLQSKKKLL